MMVKPIENILLVNKSLKLDVVNWCFKELFEVDHSFFIMECYEFEMVNLISL